MQQRLFPRTVGSILRKSRNAWVCSSCRYSSTVDPRPPRDFPPSRGKKPFYITTPIFYVNAAPHVGHLYTIILSDVIKRYQTLQGKKAILCTGTDEHGMKVQQAAVKAHSSPQPFVDKGAEIFKSLASRAGIDNDHFVRTTDPDHKEAVQYAWRLLKEKGWIYTSKHEGWYSISDETFYPESAVHLIVDPPTGRKHMASMETGKEVEWTEESNYHFRLSAFREPLLEFYEANPNWIIPDQRHNDMYNAIKNGLEDLSISRPVERLTWGIPVPDDPSQTIYVWLDALINYITKAGYPWAPEKAFAGGWPADVQVIGKDIMRFVYWHKVDISRI
jgi:methionyl-tRNA synthetase